MDKKGRQAALGLVAQGDIAKVVATGRPMETAFVGYFVVGILLHLMMFKPGSPIF